ncbi:MAG: Rrf2 family transcriptional regulator [Terracidiphilus sp.]
MQLTHFSDYSLRVLIYLAQRQGAHTTIKDISEAYRISESHLMKVVHKLSMLGYLNTVRGRGGGISLAHAPTDISIGRVVRDVEPLAIVECFEPEYDASCKLYPKCGLIGVLRAARANFLATLDAYSVADAAGSKRPSARPIDLVTVRR